MKAAINRNTILIVGSAPQYPHGVMDPIAALGKLALAAGCTRDSFIIIIIILTARDLLAREPPCWLWVNQVGWQWVGWQWVGWQWVGWLCRATSARAGPHRARIFA